MFRLFGPTLTPDAPVEHRVLADRDAALLGRLEPGDAAERGRLAAAARAEQDEELAGLDDQVEIVDRHRRRLAARSAWRVR